MQEKLVVWKPIKNYSGELHLQEFTLKQGLKLTFEDDKGKIITFNYNRYDNEAYILSHRLTEEYMRADLYKKAIDAKKKVHDQMKEWALYKVENSTYIRWYDSLPGPGTDFKPHIEHHLYISSEYVFEVISTYEPEVTIIGPNDDMKGVINTTGT